MGLEESPIERSHGGISAVKMPWMLDKRPVQDKAGDESVHLFRATIGQLQGNNASTKTVVKASMVLVVVQQPSGQ
jgi:hypothetical protein